MHSRTNNGSGERFNLIAVVMIAVLAISVAIAWFTTQPKTPPLTSSQAGAEIIAEISGETLDEYWSADRRENYFLIIDRKKESDSLTPVGWEVVSRQQDPSGGYSGALKQVVGDDFTHKSRWSLSADLSQGQYSADSPDDQTNQIATQIILDNETITVTRNVDGKTQTASTDRPENYLPEGAMPLALKLVAERQLDASFKILFDDKAIIDGAVNFTNITFKPKEDNVIKVTFSGANLNISMHYKLDDNLEISRYEFTNSPITFVACTKELVQQSFSPTTQRAPASRPAPE
ncbi:MAG: hypothetical protein HN350_12195 [Phycisphaerales bacterium]|nr:hypothetical protein [Phycisphaerales bacterium]